MEEGKATIATVKQRPIQTQDLGKNRGTGDEALGTIGVVVDSGKTNLNWDSENRLILYRNDTASGQYAYNPAGLRTNKNAQAAETFYPDESFQEYVRSGDRLQSKHIFLGKERIATVIGYPGDYGYQVNHTYYYHSDHLGSASAITDPNGRVYERNVYMPYGEKFVEELTNQLDDIHYGFTGKEKDKESGLTYFGARFLDSRTSRWLSSDPALGEYMPTGDKDKDKNLPGMGGVFNQVNMNLYHYAGNNPIKFTDPDGRDMRDARFVYDIFYKATNDPIKSAAAAFFIGNPYGASPYAQQIEALRNQGNQAAQVFSPILQTDSSINVTDNKMKNAGCNFRSTQGIAEFEVGTSLSSTQINSGRAATAETGWTGNMMVLVPEYIVNNAFDQLGKPGKTATVGWPGAPGGKLQYYVFKYSTGGVIGTHYKLANASEEVIFDPDPTVATIAVVEKIPVFIHGE